MWYKQKSNINQRVLVGGTEIEWDTSYLVHDNYNLLG